MLTCKSGVGAITAALAPAAAVKKKKKNFVCFDSCVLFACFLFAVLNCAVLCCTMRCGVVLCCSMFGGRYGGEIGAIASEAPVETNPDGSLRSSPLAPAVMPDVLLISRRGDGSYHTPVTGGAPNTSSSAASSPAVSPSSSSKGVAVAADAGPDGPDGGGPGGVPGDDMEVTSSPPVQADAGMAAGAKALPDYR